MIRIEEQITEYYNSAIEHYNKRRYRAALSNIRPAIEWVCRFTILELFNDEAEYEDLMHGRSYFSRGQLIKGNGKRECENRTIIRYVSNVYEYLNSQLINEDENYARKFSILKEHINGFSLAFSNSSVTGSHSSNVELDAKSNFESINDRLLRYFEFLRAFEILNSDALSLFEKLDKVVVIDEKTLLLQKKLEEIRAQLDAAKSKNEEVEQKINETYEENCRLEAEQEEYKKKNSELASELERKNQLISKTNQEIESRDQQIKEQEKSLLAKDEVIKAKEESVNTLKDEITKRNKDVEALKKENDELKITSETSEKDDVSNTINAPVASDSDKPKYSDEYIVSGISDKYIYYYDKEGNKNLVAKVAYNSDLGKVLDSTTPYSIYYNQGITVVVCNDDMLFYDTNGKFYTKKSLIEETKRINAEENQKEEKTKTDESYIVYGYSIKNIEWKHSDGTLSVINDISDKSDLGILLESAKKYEITRIDDSIIEVKQKQNNDLWITYTFNHSGCGLNEISKFSNDTIDKKKDKSKKQQNNNSSIIDLGNGFKLYGDIFQTITYTDINENESIVANFSKDSQLGIIVSNDPKNMSLLLYDNTLKISLKKNIGHKAVVILNYSFNSKGECLSQPIQGKYEIGQYFKKCPEYVLYMTGNRKSVGDGEVAITSAGYFYFLRQNKGCYFLRGLVTGHDSTGTIWVREKNSPTTIGHCPSYNDDDIYIATVYKHCEFNPFKYIDIEFRRGSEWSLKIKY